MKSDSVKSDRYKMVFIIGMIIVITPMVYFVLSPLYFLTPDKVLVHKINNLSTARNYYTVVSCAISAFIGIVGICLGFFYYFHKKEVDDSKSEADRRRARINLIIEQLNKFDDSVDEIVSKRVEDCKRLNYLRSKIERGPEIINALIDNRDKLNLGFSDEDIMTIVQVFSYVEKSDVINSMGFDELKVTELKYIKSDYIDKIQEARIVCYLKTE